MSEEVTNIQVFRKDADLIKELFPHLRNDAYRLAELLARVATLPRPADAQEVPLVYIQRNDE